MNEMNEWANILHGENISRSCGVVGQTKKKSRPWLFQFQLSGFSSKWAIRDETQQQIGHWFGIHIHQFQGIGGVQWFST